MVARGLFHNYLYYFSGAAAPATTTPNLLLAELLKKNQQMDKKSWNTLKLKNKRMLTTNIQNRKLRISESSSKCKKRNFPEVTYENSTLDEEHENNPKKT